MGENDVTRKQITTLPFLSPPLKFFSPTHQPSFRTSEGDTGATLFSSRPWPIFLFPKVTPPGSEPSVSVEAVGGAGTKGDGGGETPTEGLGEKKGASEAEAWEGGVEEQEGEAEGGGEGGSPSTLPPRCALISPRT